MVFLLFPTQPFSSFSPLPTRHHHECGQVEDTIEVWLSKHLLCPWHMAIVSSTVEEPIGGIFGGGIAEAEYFA